MIPLFRRMHKNLADTNQFLTYTRHSIGEIVLVVIRILIALQINTRNKHRKERAIIKILVLIALMHLAPTELAYSQSKKTIDPSEIEVLRHIIMNDTIPTVLFRTTISELNQPLARHLFYLSDFDICSSLVSSDSARLDKEERDYIVERFSTMEVMNINKLIKNPKNYTVKKLEGHNWFVISMPVVFREGEYAIYYSKSEFSGQFVLMKKIGGSWIDVCYSSVYVE